MTQTNTQSPTTIVAEHLDRYAQRGTFKGFAQLPDSRGKAHFRIKWHYDCVTDLTFDPKTSTLRFPAIFPGMDSIDGMYKAFRKFANARTAEGRLEHRRINPDRAKLTIQKRNGVVAISLKSLDGDYAYLVEKLIHLVHEIFMEFLRDGPYYEYLVEYFGADADPM